MGNIYSRLTGITLVAMLLIAGCGGSGDNSKSTAKNASPAEANKNGLTEFELNHGIGPVTEVITVGEIDPDQVEKGKELFRIKCSACHKIGQRYVGPDLQNVLASRSPSYVMNMILNPDGMVKKHPEAKKLLQEFMSPMPNQNLEREEARAIVEYLASVQTDSKN